MAGAPSRHQLIAKITRIIGRGKKLECSWGNEEKLPDAFPTNQLVELLAELDRVKDLDRADEEQKPITLVCSEHLNNKQSLGNQRLRCNGPCHRIREAFFFSKSARKNGGSGVCMNCSAWKQTHEPGLTPFAAPNQFVSADEVGIRHIIPTVPEDFWLPAGEEAETKEGDDEVASVVASTQNLTLNTPTPTASETSESLLETGTSQSTAKDKFVPPHLRGKSQPSQAGSTIDSAASSQAGDAWFSSKTSSVASQSLSITRSKILGVSGTAQNMAANYPAWDTEGTPEAAAEAPTGASSVATRSVVGGKDDASTASTYRRKPQGKWPVVNRVVPSQRIWQAEPRGHEDTRPDSDESEDEL